MGLTWRSSVQNGKMKAISSKNPDWYAVYTRPRCEKKVNTILETKGIESYCPLTRTKKKWSDRTKIVEEPLFKSYVFVNIRPDEISSVRMTEGVVNFVYWLGQPARIRESEILTIRKFLQEYSNVTAERIDFKPEQRIVVNSGVLMDREGSVIKVLKNKVVVLLEDIGFKLTALMDKQHLSPANL